MLFFKAAKYFFKKNTELTLIVYKFNLTENLYKKIWNIFCNFIHL